MDLSDGTDNDTDFSYISESEHDESDTNIVDNDTRRPILWTNIDNPADFEHSHDIQEFVQNYGPVNPPPRGSSPLIYFDKLTTSEEGDNLIDILVVETNRYAAQTLSTRQLSAHSRSNKWTDTNVIEISAFLGLFLAMGIVKKPSKASYWSESASTWLYHTPNFRQVMNRNRFQLLLQYLHCNDNTTSIPRGRRGHDPAHKIRPVLDLVNTTFKESYNLARDVTIDESIVGFKGRNGIVQYVPGKKTHRWGPKLFILAESDTGYTSHIQLYAGKRHTGDRNYVYRLGYDTVTSIVRPLYGKYHHLFVDNFFSSPALCQDVFVNLTYFTSTVRDARKGMPRSLRNLKVHKGEMIVKQSGPMMVMKYGDRKNVTLLSSFGTPIMEARENSRGVVKQIPNVNYVYNQKMGGVDLADAQLQTYDPDIRSVKMWKKILMNILLRVVAVNANILHRQNRGLRPKMNRLQFTLLLCQELIGEHRTERHIGRPINQYACDRLSSRYFVDYIPGKKRRRCAVCTKKTRFRCETCASVLCAVKCFKRFHTCRFYRHEE